MSIEDMVIGIGVPFSEEEYETMRKHNYKPMDYKDLIFSDNVNRPSHYIEGGIETIDFVKAKLGSYQFEGFCLGNALKYISRAGKKREDKYEDLKKAEWYLHFLRTGKKELDK